MPMFHLRRGRHRPLGVTAGCLARLERRPCFLRDANRICRRLLLQRRGAGPVVISHDPERASGVVSLQVKEAGYAPVE